MLPSHPMPRKEKKHSFKPDLNERLKDKKQRITDKYLNCNRSPSFHELAQFAYSSPQNEITLVQFIKITEIIERAVDPTGTASFSLGSVYSAIAT